MQDLKTGHLLGAAPKAQFWGQVIGATAGAVVSAFIYKLYTAYVYSLEISLQTKEANIDRPTVCTQSQVIFFRSPPDMSGFSPPDW